MFEQTDTNQTSSRKLTPTPIKILHVTNKLFQINGKDELFHKACQAKNEYTKYSQRKELGKIRSFLMN